MTSPMPLWSRWLLARGAALAATAAAGLALGGDQWFARLGQSAVGPFAFVSGGALAAPRRRLLVAVALAASLVVIVALGSLTRASEIAALGVGRALLLYAALGMSSAALAIVLVARGR